MTATTSTQQEWFSNCVSATMSILACTPRTPTATYRCPATPAWRGSASRRASPGVRVFAMAAHSVPAKAAVFKEINAANTADRALRVVLASNGSVMVDYLLLADAVNTDNLRAVIARVLTVADELGPMITAVHGGSTPIVPEPFPKQS